MTAPMETNREGLVERMIWANTQREWGSQLYRVSGEEHLRNKRGVEMAQRSEHLLLLQKTWIGFPAPTQWFTIIHNSSSTGSHTLLWPPLAPGMHMITWMRAMHVIQIHLCRLSTNTQKIRLNKQIEKYFLNRKKKQTTGQMSWAWPIQQMSREVKRIGGRRGGDDMGGGKREEGRLLNTMRW